MATKIQFNVYRVTAYRNGCVLRSQLVRSIWLKLIYNRPPEDELAIAREFGGDLLVATGQIKHDK